MNILKARLQAKDEGHLGNNDGNNCDCDDDNYNDNNDNDDDDDNYYSNYNCIGNKHSEDIDGGNGSGGSISKVYTMMDPCCGSGTNLFMARRYILI
jgi:hypothetical protein